MADNFSGLNVSTGQGEGAAHINHWENFYNTIGQIQQRDLAHQKAIVDAANKGNLEMGELAKGLRPKDIPKFKQYTDKFTEAALMAASKDVQKDPHQLAEWTKKKNDAYTGAMAWASTSKQIGEFRSKTIPSAVLKDKGVGWRSPEELDEMYKQYDDMDSDQITKAQLNTPTKWVIPADTFPKQDYDKHIFGDVVTKPDMQEVKDPSGRTIARETKQIQSYAHNTPTIASKTAQVINGVRDVRQAAKAEFEKADPAVIKQTMDDAQKIVEADPDSKGMKLPVDYVGYATAKNIIQGKPKVVGTSAYAEDPGYKREQDEAFKMKMADKNAAKAKSLVYLHASLAKKTDAPQSVNTQFMYDAARNPTKDIVVGKTASGNPIYMKGTQIINNAIQAIAGDNPKNVDGVQLDRWTLVTEDGRRRILEKLLPELDDTKGVTIDQLAKGNPNNHNETIQAILDQVNSKYKQNIKMDDINKYAIPVFITKKYVPDPINSGQKMLVLTPTFINPATNDFGQFHSAISNQVNTKKKNQMSTENPNFISFLQQNAGNDDDEQ